MRWKKKPSGVFLFLTLLHCALCNHHSHDEEGSKLVHTTNDIPTSVENGAQTETPKAPLISQLQDLSVLDPYNLIDGKFKSSKDTHSIVHRLIPRPAKHKEGHNTRRTKQEDDWPQKQTVTKDKTTRVSLKHGDKILSFDYQNGVPVGHIFESDLNQFLFDGEDSKHSKNVDVENVSTKDDKNKDMAGFGHSLRKEHMKRKPKPVYQRIEHGRNVLLHEAVRKLLGFTDTPDLPGSRTNSRLLPDPRKEKRLPRYVKDLYEKFQRGEMNAGLANGNTVRSIHTNIGTVEGESLFLFNLSSLRPTEKLLNAEIHLYKRRLKPWVKRLEIEMLVYHVAPHYISQAAKITIRDSASGWHWYDVTLAVKSCLATRDPRPHLLGMSFRVRSANGKNRPVALKKFGRHHSMPFLVVYSNETEAVNFEQLDLLADRLRFGDRLYNQDIHEDMNNEIPTEEIENELDEQDVDADDVDFDENDVSDHELEIIDGDTGLLESEANTSDSSTIDIFHRPDTLSTHPLDTSHNNEKKDRSKRSIFTNEIPEDPLDFERYQRRKYPIPHTHPGILKADQESRIRLGTSQIIPIPERPTRRRRRRKHRRRKNRKRFGRGGRKLKIPKGWETYQENLLRKQKEEAEKYANVCGKKKLVVDFTDIGWDDWIIAPSGFQANYCAGTCPFPLTKRLRPSNHATIQSIVHAIGIYDQVPAPCCVPDEMSSVTLLYFDEDRNVVLKNYPGMTVESCSCQ